MPVSSGAPAALRIDVVSDVVCPWCFIGKRRLENALTLVPDIPVDIHWRPYFLNPSIPRRHRPADLSGNQIRFGPALCRDRRARRCRRRDRGADLRLRQDQPPAQHARLPSPHPLVRAARPFVQHEAAPDGALFRRRRRCHRPKNVQFGGDRLRHGRRSRCAGSSPVTPTSTASKAKPTAPEAGIDGVPCFIFGGSTVVTGAQSPEYLASAMNTPPDVIRGCGRSRFGCAAGRAEEFCALVPRKRGPRLISAFAGLSDCETKATNKRLRRTHRRLTPRRTGCRSARRHGCCVAAFIARPQCRLKAASHPLSIQSSLANKPATAPVCQLRNSGTDRFARHNAIANQSEVGGIVFFYRAQLRLARTTLGLVSAS